MSSVITDIKHACRTLRRSPGFTAIAIVTLALGVGANATVFSVLDALLLRPLPIAKADQVFFVEMASGQISHSIPDYRDLLARNSTFSDMAAYRITPMALQNGQGSERVWGYLATGNYFELLGIQPALGRFFTRDEDRLPGAAPFAVISYDRWQRTFGGNPTIVGTTVRLNDVPYTVVGVAPRGFQGTEVFYRPDLWVPMSMQPQIESTPWLDNRNTWNSFLAGRLRTGVTAAQATANLNVVAEGLAAEHPVSHRGLRYRLVPPGLLGNMGRGPVSAFMVGLMTLAGLVLLAACANLGSLLGSRMIDRYREIAIRLAVGGTRLSVIRYVFIEIVLLAVAGGAAGYVVANAILYSLSQWRLPLILPVQLDVTPSLAGVAFAAAVTLGTGLLCAAAPARHAWRTDPARLVGTSALPTAFGWQIRDLVLAAQVALCCVLVFASVVSIRNLLAAFDVPIGFSTNQIAVASFDLSAAGYSPREGLRFQQRSRDAAAALPGVTAAAFSSAVPLTIDRSSSTVYPSDLSADATRGFDALVYGVSPGFLLLFQARFAAGRDFTAADDINHEHVAVVNRTFARRVLLTEDAINMRFRTGAGRMVRVVGLVEDGKYGSLAEAPQAAMFRPAAQSYSSTTALLVRSSLPAAVLARELEGIVTRLDRRVPILSRGSLSDTIAVAFLPARAAGVALGAFGVLALLLAVVGVYGLAAYSVSARAREIGIRVAIGARPPQALRFVLGRTAMLLGMGSIAGIIAGVAAAPLLGQIAYHASARDPLIISLVAVAMAMVGLGAAWVPARRVLKLDPAQTLRDA
ncbi:MAG TPA: ABC transporter permease [Vicinamibacterales bacterium]|nr:ABC transporter permease [Vicinamibacterales bacterium]